MHQAAQHEGRAPVGVDDVVDAQVRDAAQQRLDRDLGFHARELRTMMQHPVYVPKSGRQTGSDGRSAKGQKRHFACAATVGDALTFQI